MSPLAGWKLKHRAYYYRHPVDLRDLWDGKTEYRLGLTLSEAHKVWANRIEFYAKDVDWDSICK